jgi:hypothetical protein
MTITLEFWRNNRQTATIKTRIYNLNYWMRNMPEEVSATIWFQ